MENAASISHFKIKIAEIPQEKLSNTVNSNFPLLVPLKGCYSSSEFIKPKVFFEHEGIFKVGWSKRTKKTGIKICD